MKIEEREGAELKKHFTITVPAEDVEAQVEQELKEVGKSAKIAGFRPGFVPVKILKQRYGKNVQGEVVRKLVDKAAQEVLIKRNLRAALSPDISIKEYKEGGELVIDLKVELLPVVPAIDFSKIELEREDFEVTEADIDNALQRLAERSPALKALPESAKAKTGNVVTMDFVGKVDGKPFDGGTAQGFNIELGSGRLISGFEDQLIGAKAGDEKTIKVTFPEDYFTQDLAGKPAEFDVKVTAVSELGTPEINEEFATSKGFSDLRGLRDAVRDQVKKDVGQIVRTRLKKQLFDALDPKCEYGLPEGMVDMEFKGIWQRLQDAKAEGDMAEFEGKSEDQLKKEYKAIAERRVRLGILLADIGSKERIQVSREELSRALIQHASQFPGQEKRVVEFYRQNPERLDELRGPILEEKAVDWVLGKVSLSDKKVTIDELTKADEEGSGSDNAKKPAKSTKVKAAKPAAEADEAGEEKPAKKSTKSTTGAAKSTSRKKASDTDND